MVLIFQAFVILTIGTARIHSRAAATIAAAGWSILTLILVFMPWLMILQLTVIWGSYSWFHFRPAFTLPEGDPGRKYALFAAICFALGPFILPLFFVGGIAGVLAWRRTSADYTKVPKTPLQHITPSTPNWRAHYFRACESPAEIAFLKAMIARYRLKPKKGVLVAPGIKLEMQKPISRYRADFVLNDRLVVEIDGARWHGSPEAKARDAKRDREMQAMRFEVLRIPAKTVFRTPKIAIKRINAALCSI